ncbi:IMP-specific 5'-nucleotidase, putative [Plasmodium ovale wallikeri]|uniref:IMP-specific 5'-nucleotidase 1 n=1 Tax=Plasmodium ovale wallikeri TaxID=864142 RepID=A0A1A8ZKZ6_PLAOA|nr:IMP-specific 5'-nucleotidase, putative [Plasmodium ovale wallikeri]
MDNLNINVYETCEDMQCSFFEPDKYDFLALSDRSVINSHMKKNIVHWNNRYSYNQLKNKDSLIMFLVDIFKSLFLSNCIDKNIDNVLSSIEEMFTDHYNNPMHSRLKYLIDDVGIFFTKLPITKAFHTYNRKYRITKRLYAPPTFNEVRHILNLAQILSLEDGLDLLTFDADETLYPDGYDFHDEVLASYISSLLKKMNIAIVTAASYNNDAEKYQKRLANLLKYFSKHNIEDGSYKNFYVMGGESNYLFKCNEESNLYSVPEEEWCHYKKKVDDKTVENILNISQKCLEQVISDFKLCAQIQRKEKSIGLVPNKIPSQKEKNYMIKYEVLEEAVIRVKKEIIKNKIEAPYCAFNGGQDLWVDIGNKAEGLIILQKLLNIQKKKCCHIGDQFLHSGNDFPTRFCSLTLWISNPQETKACLKSIMNMNMKSFIPEVLYENE